MIYKRQSNKPFGCLKKIIPRGWKSQCKGHEVRVFLIHSRNRKGAWEGEREISGPGHMGLHKPLRGLWILVGVKREVLEGFEQRSDVTWFVLNG